MKLSEIRKLPEAVMSDMHIDAQEKAMKLFGFSDGDATDTVDFATGDTDWEALSDEVREKLYSRYEKETTTGYDKENNNDPIKFIRPGLKADLGI